MIYVMMSVTNGGAVLGFSEFLDPSHKKDDIQNTTAQMCHSFMPSSFVKNNTLLYMEEWWIGVV